MSKKTKTSVKASKYRFDGDGVRCPVQLKDVPAQGYTWGNVSGLALVVDLFHWRDVLTPDQAEDFVTEYLRSMMEEASEELAATEGSGRNDHRGVAVGMLEGFAALVEYALKSSEARAFMTKKLNDSVRQIEQMEAEELAKQKALALNIHGIANADGGTSHE